MKRQKRTLSKSFPSNTCPKTKKCADKNKPKKMKKSISTIFIKKTTKKTSENKMNRKWWMKFKDSKTIKIKKQRTDNFYWINSKRKSDTKPSWKDVSEDNKKNKTKRIKTTKPNWNFKSNLLATAWFLRYSPNIIIESSKKTKRTAILTGSCRKMWRTIKTIEDMKNNRG